MNRGMYLENLSDVRNYCDEIVCIYSDDDPYVNYEAEKKFADMIATEQVMIKGGGHLNSESGYREFPEFI